MADLLTLTQCEIASGISRFTWYKMIHLRGQVKAQKIGNQLFVTADEVARILKLGDYPRPRGRPVGWRKQRDPECFHNKLDFILKGQHKIQLRERQRIHCELDAVMRAVARA